MRKGQQLRIADLMERSGVKFGTSGARGLVTDMTDEVCYAYTTGFLQHLAAQGELAPGANIALAGDLRPSTDRIMASVALAIRDAGYIPVNCGKIPSPAVAYYGFTEGIPSIMITGSHIPDDRNGIKFNRPDGEILKPDEQAIRNQTIDIPADRFTNQGQAAIPLPSMPVDGEAFSRYCRRYLDFFPGNCLTGLRIGLYEHSTVAREPLMYVLGELGADVTPLGRSEAFLPVDTEAIRPEDIELARQWADERGFDAIVSADGDGDRPLVSDEKGEWLRGDIVGILTALYLDARDISTPVSSNTAVEKCRAFQTVRRTRIGSPYVIEAMNTATASPAQGVVGYEANGGFLVGTEFTKGKRKLAALPTRDAMLPILSILALVQKQHRPISSLLRELPQRFTASDRLKNITTELSQRKLAELREGADEIERLFGRLCGPIASIDNTDGLRTTFQNQEIIHLRASGNAPELRCYTEAATEQRAKQLNEATLAIWQSHAHL